ncbi:MAG TPA: type II secretion system protein [Mycobacteriales bacterium]|nr:type II secretion system protein [Mycobacteriales bacterium]
MSRLRRTAGDDGFSLVEILVSITIFGVAATAVLPLLLAGIRGGTHAKLTTQAKNIAQERMELIRNLPFYIAQQNGDYRDVLDVYFRDLRSPGTVTASDPCVSRRYLAATTSYQCTLPATTIGGARFNQVVESKFISASGAVVAPRADYDSQVVNRDAPASNLLEAVITTTWTQGGTSRDFVLRSRVANTATDAPLVTSKISGSAVKVTSTTTDGSVLQFEGGLLSAEGSKATASSANASAVGAYGSLSSGATVKGAEVTLSAPPDQLVTLPVSGAERVLGTDCSLLCFGDSKIKGAGSAKVSNQVPQVGIDGVTNTLEAQLSRSGGFGERGFSYSNTDVATAGVALPLVNALPLVSAGTGTTGSIASSWGSLDATPNGTTSVTAKVSASSRPIQLFRTAAAPDGLVQLELTSAALTCVDGAGRGVSASWGAKVRVHTSSGYVEYAVAPGGTALPDPGLITTSTGLPLSRYVTSWSGLTSSTSSVAQTATAGVSANIPAVLNVLTAPTRSGDAQSVLNVSLGSLSCEAEDNQ